MEEERRRFNGSWHLSTACCRWESTCFREVRPASVSPCPFLIGELEPVKSLPNWKGCYLRLHSLNIVVAPILKSGKIEAILSFESKTLHCCTVEVLRK